MRLNWLVGLLLFFVTYSFSQSRDTTYFVYQDLDSNVNTTYSEAGPRISPDGSKLYFFRVDHPESLKGSNEIWVSSLSADSTWTLAEKLGEPLNNYNDNAVHSISEDGNELLVHDIYLKNQTSKAGLSITKKQADGTWGFPKKLNIKKYQNTNDVCSFYFSDDWKTLILAIETEESNGKQDLYVSFNEGGNSWSEPKNLGTVVNSKGSEATAFLTNDQKTLYFSTDGRTDSYGGFDIYKTTRLDDTWENWSEPENIGAPYNTKENEFYFSIPPQAGGWAYLSHSDKNGNSDIARIKQVTEPLPTPEIMIFGLVYDNSTKKSISGDITFTLTPIDSLVGQVSADTGKGYNHTLEGYQTYTYSIKKEGYEDFTGTLDFSEINSSRKQRVDIYLTPIPVPQAELLTLKSVEFKTAKWDILPEFVLELDKAVVFLNTYKDYNYEVAGHTDSRDTDARNQVLSEKRAQSVRDYLIAKGIQAERLTAVGYGEKEPIMTNETKEGRQRNRRVVLTKK